MAEYVAKRDRNRCPTHPGELLRENVIPATGKTKSEIAALLGISRRRLYDTINGREALELAGIEFIDENGGGRGARLRKSSQIKR